MIGGSLFWNPIVRREALTRMRSTRTALLLLGFLAILGAVAYSTYASQVSVNANVSQVSRAGITVFVALAAAVIALITVLVPGLTGGAIAGERERQTLDLLLCTKVHPWRIVVGKLVGSLLFVLFLLLASLPVLSVVSLLGGVQLGDILVVVVSGAVTAVALGSLGILASCVNRRATGATLSAYLATLLFFAAPPLVGSILQASHSVSSFSYSTSLGSGGARSVVIGSSGGGAGVAVPFVSGGSGIPLPPSTSYGYALYHPGSPPVVEMLSPAMSVSGTLTTLESQANCGPSTSFPAIVTCISADQITDGVFSNWHYWQVGLLFQGILALLCITASILVVRGRIPRTRRVTPPPATTRTAT